MKLHLLAIQAVFYFFIFCLILYCSAADWIPHQCANPILSSKVIHERTIACPVPCSPAERGMKSPQLLLPPVWVWQRQRPQVAQQNPLAMQGAQSQQMPSPWTPSGQHFRQGPLGRASWQGSWQRASLSQASLQPQAHVAWPRRAWHWGQGP